MSVLFILKVLEDLAFRKVGPCLQDDISYSQNWQLIKTRVPESHSSARVLNRRRIDFIGARRRLHLLLAMSRLERKRCYDARARATTEVAWPRGDWTARSCARAAATVCSSVWWKPE
eukprot:6212972-Pleurochrysis_carterae.AAC.1